jgi:hypothetical protein
MRAARPAGGVAQALDACVPVGEDGDERVDLGVDGLGVVAGSGSSGAVAAEDSEPRTDERPLLACVEEPGLDVAARIHDSGETSVILYAPAGGSHSSTLFPSGSMTQPNFP